MGGHCCFVTSRSRVRVQQPTPYRLAAEQGGELNSGHRDSQTRYHASSSPVIFPPGIHRVGDAAQGAPTATPVGGVVGSTGEGSSLYAGSCPWRHGGQAGVSRGVLPKATHGLSTGSGTGYGPKIRALTPICSTRSGIRTRDLHLERVTSWATRLCGRSGTVFRRTAKDTHRRAGLSSAAATLNRRGGAPSRRASPRTTLRPRAGTRGLTAWPRCAAR